MLFRHLVYVIKKWIFPVGVRRRFWDAQAEYGDEHAVLS